MDTRLVFNAQRLGVILIGLTLFFSAISASAYQYSRSNRGKTYAIQNKLYDVSHEFVLMPGLLPMDAFYKGAIATVGYTYHFNTTWAWEVLQLNYSKNFDTDLKRKLAEDFNTPITPTQFPEIDYLLTSSLMITPFYGKQAWFNGPVVQHETYFTFGPAAFQLNDAATNLSWKPAIHMGIGFRWYVDHWVSVKLEAREFLYFTDFPNGVEDSLLVSFGLGFHFTRN